LIERIKTFWKVLEAVFPKDSLSRMLLQFSLVVVLGTALTSYFTSVREKNIEQRELLITNLNDRTSFVYELTKAVSTRLFHMQLVYWELTIHNETNHYRQKELLKKYNAYYDILIEWNGSLKYHQLAMDFQFAAASEKIRKIIEVHKLDKLEVSDSLSKLSSEELHSKFQMLHRGLKKAKDKRIEMKQKLSEADLESLRRSYKELPDVAYQYLTLIHEISRDPVTLRSFIGI